MASCAMPQVEPKVVQSVAERTSKILADFTQKQAQSLSAAMRDEMGIAKAYMDMYAKLASDPALEIGRASCRERVCLVV